jgi:hypothetical protein
MMRGVLFAGLAIGMGAGSALAQVAADAPPAATGTPTAVAPAPADPFAQAIAARQVAEFARRERDPYAMLTAARMLQQIPVTDDPTASGGEAAAFSPTALFAEAKTLARDDQQLLLQIRVTASAFGAGLVRRVLDVNPRNAYRFNVTAKGGEPLRIGAIGDIGTSMYIRLTDTSGKQICLDDNADYAPVCAVTPRKSGNYRVDIGNKSAARSRTVILSN